MVLRLELLNNSPLCVKKNPHSTLFLATTIIPGPPIISPFSLSPHLCDYVTGTRFTTIDYIFD